MQLTQIDQNLYIGTSASELLHFVQIPPDPADISGKPSYILASRLSPTYVDPPTAERPGVQQILLLPRSNKACILCNWTVTFYSLPELSPVLTNSIAKGCNWVGGVDLNIPQIPSKNESAGPATTVLFSLNKKIRVVRIADEARGLKVCVLDT